MEYLNVYFCNFKILRAFRGIRTRVCGTGDRCHTDRLCIEKIKGGHSTGVDPACTGVKFNRFKSTNHIK